MTTRTSALALVLAASCLLSLSAAAQQPSTPAAKVQALETKWNDAYKASNISAMDALLADDFIITVEDGSTFSKAGYIAHVNDPDTHVSVSEMADVKVRMHGDTAVVTGAYHEKGVTKGKPYEFRDRFTDVWQNIGGKWMVIVSHYSMPTR